MFSRVLSSNSRFVRQYSRLSRSVSGLSRFTSQSSRSYSTGASSASPFQIGFAVAAGLGCGAALLYGNRLFAVEDKEPLNIPCMDPHCPCHDASLHPCTLEHHFVPGCHELKIISGNSNKPLADRVAKCLGTEVTDCSVGRFNDGEISVQVKESVRGKDVYVIQSLCAPTNDNLMELVFMLSAVRRASAKRVTSIIPFFSYRQNLQRVNGLPAGTSFVFSSAADVAKMLEVAGVDYVMLVDMESRSNVSKLDGGLFSNRTPVEVLDASNLIFDYLKHKVDPSRKIVVLTPHPKDLPRAALVKKQLAEFYPGLDIRAMEGEYVTQILQGEEDWEVEDMRNPETLKNCDVIIVDFAVASGKTMTRWANFVKSKGANRVIGLASHGLLLNQAPELIQISPLEEVMILDTVPVPQEKIDRCNKLRVISVGPMIASAIKDIHYVDKKRFVFKSE
ncbi:hypothetical protein WA588_003350 [Blastocystis sp. NMH]